MKKRWSENEIELLKNNFDKEDSDLEVLFPHRSLKSIKHKINSLSLPRVQCFKHYTDEEINFLKLNYRLSKEELTSALNRDWESIRKKLSELNIDYHLTFKVWSKEEVELLLTSKSAQDAIEKLPNRSEQSVRCKLSELGMTFKDWKTEDVNFLIENYPSKDANFIATELNRTLPSIYKKANSLGLKRDQFTIKRGMKGSKNPNWKGGIGSENARLRDSLEYKNWRNKVFQRDSYTCRCCGNNKGGNLHAHHVENFSENVELRFVVDNGLTLCNDCHNPNVTGSFHNIYGTRNNTKQQLEEFIKTKQLIHI
ncbi:HNH endonuclease [Priestia flexa]|uniref:HNH endonuclease n=1 Tax=Priestia flexa TaxID=86664 RepID=UPI0004738A88|nr:HNH endonuclease [Priestia flexa]